jgi:hypothetical protein
MWTTVNVDHAREPSEAITRALRKTTIHAGFISGLHIIDVEPAGQLNSYLLIMAGALA